MDSSNTVIVSVMVEEKGRQTADKKESRKPWTLREFGGQMVWDWLHLLSALAIPVVLALARLYFEAQLDERQRSIENQRAEAERELANQRAQDEALQAYLSQMSTLMLEKHLRDSKVDSEVRTLARARTLTVIRRVDTSRKDEIMQFLLEADLVHRVGGSAPVIELGGAALGDTSLFGADLSGANLSSANLSSANLSYANLSYANPSEADLRGADLLGANLISANLSVASLLSANLGGTTLGDNPSGADLRERPTSEMPTSQMPTWSVPT